MLSPHPESPFIRRSAFALLAVLVSVVAIEDVAWGQLFGERNIGQPLQARQRQGQTAPPDLEAVGTIDGSRRFLRDNRERGSFVGSGREDVQGFVGSQQAIGSGRVRAATDDLRPPPDESARINRPLPPLRPGAMLYPRLTLADGMGVDGGPPAASPSDVLSPDPRLQESLAKHASGPIRVLRNGDRAVLEGSVPSRQEADRLKLLLSFEPGIYQIEDRLTVGDG